MGLRWSGIREMWRESKKRGASRNCTRDKHRDRLCVLSGPKGHSQYARRLSEGPSPGRRPSRTAAGSSFATPPAPPGVSDGKGERRSALLPLHPLLLALPAPAKEETPPSTLPVF